MTCFPNPRTDTVDTQGACRLLKCSKSTLNCLWRERSLSFVIGDDGRRLFLVKEMKQLRHVHPLLSWERLERWSSEHDCNRQLELDEDEGPLY